MISKQKLAEVMTKRTHQTQQFIQETQHDRENII